MPTRTEERQPAGDDFFTVTEITRRIKSLLEGTIPNISVEGEISGLKASPSGHIYFCLKDNNALIDAVVWRSAAMKLKDIPKDGEKVVARGKITVYEPRGRYQLVVTSFQTSGKGDLWRKFEELKEKLAAEGLFDQERKVPIPESPKTIGIVTSPSGAALQDILKIVRRRAPGMKVVVSPALVQGKGSAADIARALQRLDDWGGADVIIVGRGGGSLEDLWSFNEEAVARAIATAKTPVVSAVGHETDFTIADFVADARAATPSEAAEKIAPDQNYLRGRIAHAATVLARALSGQIREQRERLSGMSRMRAYNKPLDMFMPLWQRLDDTLSDYRTIMERKLEQADSRIRFASTRLDAMSPFGVLARGYAVALDSNGKPITDSTSVHPGDRVTVKLHRGKIGAAITETYDDTDGE
jgi:exodeoxyribonuclease VII, large subunit